MTNEPLRKHLAEIAGAWMGDGTPLFLKFK